MIIDCHPADEADIRAYAAYVAERRRLAMELWAVRNATRSTENANSTLSGR